MLNSLVTPRMRMFAGPNGSGKSTMKSVLKPELLGAYINPDDIEKEIKKSSWLNFDDFNIKPTQEELIIFLEQSTLLEKAALKDEIFHVRIAQNKNVVSFHDIEINSYWASVMADFIRFQLLKTHQSFTFETVMSSPDKVQLLEKAKQLGYKTYLYYVATEDPSINIERVKNRVKEGGHNVPEDKIISRYHRSLDLLLDAVKQTNRAYLFDNSSEKLSLVAEITNGATIEFKSEIQANWFEKAIIDKL